MKRRSVKFAGALALAIALPAHADFSYRTTSKSGGAMGSATDSQPGISTYYYKGQKVKIDDGTRAIVIDFGAGTITTVDNSAKTVAVRSFADADASQGDADVKIDVKDTGVRKNVNGFTASETVLTMQLESPNARVGPLQLEVDLWLAGAVPGAEEVRAFHEKNGARFPWAAIGGGSIPQMQKALAEVERKMSTMHGVPVQQVIRLRAAGAGNMPGVSSSEAARVEAGMAQARARLEAMKAAGGQQAVIAEQMLSKMGGGPAGGGAASSTLVEITIDSSDFSSAPIPDSVFAIPADYRQIN